MKATNSTTPAMSSPSFTHATRCTVPRSSPLLSSSFTPFYPRSQQQLYHQHSGSVGNNDGDLQSSVQHSEDADADQSHFSSWSHPRSSKLYDQQYYACPGVEPYEISWFSNSGTVWDGCAWQQWGDTGEYVYAEDDTGDSANIVSGSLSYYAGSSALDQDIYVSSTSNSTSIPVLFPDKGANFLIAHANESAEADPKSSTSISGRTAMSNAFYSSVMQEQACSGKKRNEDILSSLWKSNEHAVSGNRQVPAKGGSIEAANEFTRSNVDAKPYPMQVTAEMSSGFASYIGELKLTADSAENIEALTEGNVPLRASHNLSKEQGSVDVTKLKHAMSSALNGPDTSVSMDTLGHSLSTSFPSTFHILQTEGSLKNVSHHSGIDHLHPSGDHCPSLIDTQALEQMNNINGLHEEQTSTKFDQPECFGSYVNGRPHPLVECIYNLSKVLLSSQSKASSNALSSADCLTLENTICMLSHQLFLRSASESNFHHEPNCQQVAEEKSRNSGDSTKCGMQPAGSLQEDASQSVNMKHIVSLPRDLQTKCPESTPKFTANTYMGGDKHIMSLKKDLEVSQEELIMLKGEVQKLEEQVSYERAESNVTVLMYKKLWSEAQEALKVSRSEIWKIRSELDALKQELVQLKNSGGTHREAEIASHECSTSINQGGNHENFSGIVTSYSLDMEQLPLDLNGPSTEDRNITCSGSLKEAPEVVAGCFDPKMVWKDEILKVFERPDSTHSDQATSSDHSGKKPELCADKLNSSHAIPPPTNLDHDVARRLSLLLSRPGLDLNKTCTESSVEWPSRSGTALDLSTNVKGEDEAAPPISLDYLVWSETSYLLDGNKGPGCVSDHGLADCEPIDGGKEFKGGTSQEDEIEIICFRPGIADMLKGEPEWEDVAVNMINDLSSAKNETV